MKKLIGILGLLGILNRNASAEPTLQLEALREVPVNQTVVRTTASATAPGELNLFAFADYVGHSSDAFYSEASAGRELSQGLGAKLEWNGGTGVNDLFRFGPEYKRKFFNDKLFLDTKIYPANFGADGILKNIGQFSNFTSLQLPRRSYLENWTDVNINYPKITGKPFVQSETTLGKTLVGNLSLEIQEAHNVNLLGEQARVGLRYGF